MPAKFSTVFCSAVCTLLILISCGSLSADEPTKAFALLLDQPAGIVSQPESGQASEIARRAADKANARLDILYLAEDGQIVDAKGQPASLQDFAAVWVYQGDTIRQSGPLFSGAVKKQLTDRLDAGKTVFLSGGAAALAGSLGDQKQTLAALTFGNDRCQSGLIPARWSDSFWTGLNSDRNAFWFSNAVYPTFANYTLTGPNVAIWGSNPGGPVNPGVALIRSEGVALCLPVQVSPVYIEADPVFKANFEALVYNILTWSNTAESRAALLSGAKPYNPLPTAALRRAIEDIQARFPDKYLDGKAYLDRLTALEKQIADAGAADNPTTDQCAAFAELQKTALLANPALNFDSFLYIQRNAKFLGLPQNYNSNSVLQPTIEKTKLGLPNNSNSNSILPPTGYSNTIRQFNWRTGEDQLVFEPTNDLFVGDMDLHFDAGRILFSMPNPEAGNRWRLWELNLADKSVKLVPTVEESDVDNYDGCYLADDGIAFCSTACFTGVPCIDGSGHVCNLYRREASGQVRQLTLEQDHDWCPTLLQNGRVMYLRWEYSDLPHAFSRILMHTNPDGTNQSEFYGSNSYWPGSMFYARQLPNQPSKFVAIVGGHHEQNRIGDLVVFDTSKGRKETEGAVQRVPGFGKPVCRQILDLPIAQSYPQFTHPFPITDKEFLVSVRMRPGEGWRICLADVFDNIVPLKSVPYFACFEPVPIRKTERPPVIMDRTDYDRQDADVFIADVYYGEGLKGVPRGTVKALRVMTYQFSYQGMGAEPHSVGLDGPWDPKIVLGTVPVNEDGSAHFSVPALTPCSLQPLDERGNAVQLMRSWFTAMPGEGVSCVGCHEAQNSVPPPRALTQASRQAPVKLQAAGPKQGFSFEKEIQPILNKYCADCHEQKTKLTFKQGPVAPTLENGNYICKSSRFSQAYYNLRRYVRTPTKESQMDLLSPYEFYAENQPLMRLLGAGHYEVQLDDQARRTLITWIDLNCPYYGNWGEIRNYAIADRVTHQWTRRTELRKKYGGIVDALDDNPTSIPGNASADAPKELATVDLGPAEYVAPELKEPTAARDGEILSFDLGNGQTLECRRLLGQDGFLSVCEISNAQYRAFDPRHNSGVEFADFIHFSPGEAWHVLNRDAQPVVRVSRPQAQAFCDWLSKKTGRKVELPTADQWQTAADAGIAGADKPFWFGGLNTDYSTLENLSDWSNAAINPISWTGRLATFPAWRIADVKVNDHARTSAPVGSYRPNPMGFFDMYGNVAEWTQTDAANGKAVICGGSWYEPLRDADRAARREYYPYQTGFDVGFRVIVK